MGTITLAYTLTDTLYIYDIVIASLPIYFSI